MVAQIIAIALFIIMFVMIVTEKIERQWVSLGSALIMLVFLFGFYLHDMDTIWEILNIKEIVTLPFWYATGSAESTSVGINWATIFFIGGMMVMVEGMAKAGFFRWLCLSIAKMVKYKAVPILITFMLMSFVLSMFIDSITVILFLAAVTVELASLLGFSPIPIILAEIFCSNLGGSATMCGDPPNIIIGTSLGYSFMDFFTNTGIIAAISLVFTVAYFYLMLRKNLKKQSKTVTEYPQPSSAIENKGDFAVSCVIFGLAVVLLITHAMTGLTVATIGIGIAIITLVTSRGNRLQLLKKVDYETLLFFVGLFVLVGGLEKTGVLGLISGFIQSISAGNPYIMIAIILWVSALTSAFVDNIPFAATMIPVIRTLAISSGVPLEVLSWTLAIGTDIGGSATPIGASANVVGVSISNKNGYFIGWKRYCKLLAPITVLVMIISNVCIYIRYF